MSTEELSVYEGLLLDYYGIEYISDWDVLRDLLELEFDIKFSIRELQSISKFNFSINAEDVELTMRHCGVNY